MATKRHYKNKSTSLKYNHLKKINTGKFTASALDLFIDHHSQIELFKYIKATGKNGVIIKADVQRAIKSFD